MEEEAIKNLKVQRKELEEEYAKNATDKGARAICDIVVEVKNRKDTIRQYKEDIAVNIEELRNTKK